MTKGNIILSSDTFPIQNSWGRGRKCSEKGDCYVWKRPPQRCWGTPYCLSHCMRVFLPSLLPQSLTDECTWSMVRSMLSCRQTSDA